MSVRINLEIGHEASLRTKRTQEGFTHDWEVFVRGADNAAIHYYVEKVVFHLHETFKNPKRVKKEPPYSVKESGYAGFIIVIEVYLRTKEEPKKLKFHYDLRLQPTGPTIFKVQKEKHIFHNPPEDFKQKLLKGGGVIVTNSQEYSRENQPSSEEKTQLLSKPKLSGSDYVKKHKPKVESNNFQELFGTPITKTSKSIEVKPTSKEKSSNNASSTKPGSSEKDKAKYSPYKEKDREKFKDKIDFSKKEKEEKRKEEKKDRSKDREKKEKREKSPTPSKRSSSPRRPPSPVPKYKDKEEKKVEVLKKNGEDTKEKIEKKAKKEKRDKDKEKHESKRKDSQKVEQKDKSLSSKDKEKIKETSPVLLPKPEKKEKINLKDFIKETENGKIKPDKEERVKHKHKKKDKEREKNQ